MQKVTEKDPAMAARIMDLVQAGVRPDQIAQKLDEELSAKRLLEEEGPPPEEQFPEEILLISQALAFTIPKEDDAERICKLLNDAYIDETIGDEAFRQAAPVVEVETMRSMLTSEDYKWVAVEVPDGRGVEEDGALLGISCFTTDGVSRRNGEVEGALGSIRFFGVLRKYRGVLIGQRLLYRTEKALLKAGCVRVMACAPSSREHVMSWLERRGYQCAGGMPYPYKMLGQELLDHVKGEELHLVRFLKKLTTAHGSSTDLQADGKAEVEPTVLALVAHDTEKSGADDVSESVTGSVSEPLVGTGAVDNGGEGEGGWSENAHDGNDGVRVPTHGISKHPLERLVARNES